MNEYRVKDNTGVLVWRAHPPAQGVDDAVEQGVLDLYVFRLQRLEQQGVQQRGAGEQTSKRGRTEGAEPWHQILPRHTQVLR